MLSKEQVRYENDQEAVLAFLGNGQARPRMCSRKNTFQAAVAALEKEKAESFVQANAAQLLLKKHVLSKEQKRMVKRQYWPFLAMAAIESGMACSFIHTRSRKGEAEVMAEGITQWKNGYRSSAKGDE